MKPEMNRVVRVIKKVRETDLVTSLYFDDGPCSFANPGQFVMIWIPGLDEIPMSLSIIDKNGPSAITVQNVGETTKVLCNSKIGDKIGIRGPFGNGYKIIGRKPLIVAGGTGVASLNQLANDMKLKDLNITFILGSKSKDKLVFEETLMKLLDENLLVATDDGSKGFKGLASEYAKKLMNEKNFDQIYACGPEIMISSICKHADSKKIPVQASLERHIKCAIGLCGSCAIGQHRICKDGPVLNSVQLRELTNELGLKKMKPSGRMTYVNN
jgi:dihydroorotate dehydrogenase electron transfer subunit